MEKIFDGYSIRARYFPSLLCLVPFILGKLYVVDPWLLNHSSMTWLTSYLGDATISLVLLYILIQVNRTVAKVVFENKKEFPTVQCLLATSTDTSQSYRESIATKVQAEFGLNLPTPEEQEADLDLSKKRIGEAVQLMINKVRNGYLVLKHNVEYGFFRNLAGGSLVALFASLILAAFAGWYMGDLALYSLSLKVAVAYLVVMLFAWTLLKHYSKSYARVLFREYLGS